MRQLDHTYARDAMKNTLAIHPDVLHDNRTFGEVMVQ